MGRPALQSSLLHLDSCQDAAQIARSRAVNLARIARRRMVVQSADSTAVLQATTMSGYRVQPKVMITGTEARNSSPHRKAAIARLVQAYFSLATCALAQTCPATSLTNFVPS